MIDSDGISAQPITSLALAHEAFSDRVSTGVSETPDGEPAIQAVRETEPDVALIDVTMPRTGGMQAIQQIARNCGKTRVLVLTMHGPAYLRSVMASGASGYVLKKSVDADLLSAIRTVHRGETFVDAGLAGVLVQDLFTKKGASARRAGPINILSDRELEVLRLVAQGYGSQQIAEEILVDRCQCCFCLKTPLLSGIFRTRTSIF